MRFTATVASDFRVRRGPIRGDQDRHEVAAGCRTGEGDGHRGSDDERRPGDDERVGVEERARGSTGEGDDEAHERDRDGALHDEARRPQAGDRQDVVGEEDEDAADGQHEEEGVLGVRPEPGRVDDDGGRQEVRPAGDPDDPIVGRRGDAVAQDGGRVKGRDRPDVERAAVRDAGAPCRVPLVEPSRERGAQDDPEKRDVQHDDGAEPCREPGVRQWFSFSRRASPATRKPEQAVILACRPAGGRAAARERCTRATATRRRRTGPGRAAQ